jgi:hypothetical protein
MRILRHARGNPETELGRHLRRARQVGLTTEKGEGSKVGEASDRLIVLGARESRVHGEGVGRVTELAKETSPGHEESVYEANLTAGNSDGSSGSPQFLMRCE